MFGNELKTPIQKPDLPFTEVPGLKVRMADDASILDYYKLFINLIPKETNTFGVDKINNWEPITLQDIQRMLAIVMLTGIIRKPTFNSYWSTDPKVATPFFNSVKTRDKFPRILRALHFVDNDIPSIEHANKINPVLNLLSARFSAVYQPKQQISIDESFFAVEGMT